jgi:hypothetical protein
MLQTRFGRYGESIGAARNAAGRCAYCGHLLDVSGLSRGGVLLCSSCGEARPACITCFGSGHALIGQSRAVVIRSKPCGDCLGMGYLHYGDHATPALHATRGERD